jgi:hypothetical protein
VSLGRNVSHPGEEKNMPKEVVFKVNSNRVDILQDKVTIVEGKPFDLVFQGFVPKADRAPTDVDKIRISDVKVLRYKSSDKSYVYDDLATKDWEIERFKTATTSDSITKSYGHRQGDSDVPNKAHRLIKFMLTVTLKSGAEVKIDPIIDERPT